MKKVLKNNCSFNNSVNINAIENKIVLIISLFKNNKVTNNETATKNKK